MTPDLPTRLNAFHMQRIAFRRRDFYNDLGRRFGVEYTLAGMDLLLHRIGWSVQVPARRAARRDEVGCIHGACLSGLRAGLPHAAQAIRITGRIIEVAGVIAAAVEPRQPPVVDALADAVSGFVSHGHIVSDSRAASQPGSDHMGTFMPRLTSHTLAGHDVA
jgi:hypothetical protein